MPLVNVVSLAQRNGFGYAGAMISVLIQTRNDEEALARTLASLVGGSIEGVVREVIVQACGSTDQTRLVAEHAGCSIAGEGELAAAIARARGDWLLVLLPGVRLTEGWTEQVLLHMGEGAGPARFTCSRIGQPGFFTRLFASDPPFADGLLMSKKQALALLKGEDLASIGRGVAAKRLAAQIVRAAVR